jgi:hypothetical protein
VTLGSGVVLMDPLMLMNNDSGDVMPEEDDLRPDYDQSALKGVSEASTSPDIVPGRTLPCSRPTCAQRSRPMRRSTRHYGR